MVGLQAGGRRGGKDPSLSELATPVVLRDWHPCNSGACRSGWNNDSPVPTPFPRPQWGYSSISQAEQPEAREK